MARIGTDSTVQVSITTGTVAVAILSVLVVALLWYLLDIVLIVLTAVVIASATEPGIRGFVRWGLPRVLAVLLLYLIVLAVFFCVLFFFLPPVLDDAATFLTQLPDTLRALQLSDKLDASPLSFSGLASLLSSADFLRGASANLAQSGANVFTTLAAFFGGIVSFALVVVFSFYFSVQETGVDDFLRVVTPVKYHDYVLGLWKRSQDKIGKWMQGQLLLAALVGVILYLCLTVLGIPYALLLAVLAAIFELIPVFGQFLAAIPAIAVAAVDGGITQGLIVAGVYIVVQQFEAHLIYPLVVKKVVGVPPLLVILALLVGGKLAGFIGVLLSVPVAAALQEFISDIEARRARELAREKENA